jgi:hypothetical protein
VKKLVDLVDWTKNSEQEGEKEQLSPSKSEIKSLYVSTNNSAMLFSFEGFF